MVATWRLYFSCSKLSSDKCFVDRTLWLNHDSRLTCKTAMTREMEVTDMVVLSEVAGPRRTRVVSSGRSDLGLS